VNSIFEPSVRVNLLGRIGQLKPESRPSFGKMNVNQMLVHCTGAIQMMIGELQVARKPGPFRNPFLRYMVIHVLPWPKGLPTAPELIPPADSGDFTSNVGKLKTAVERLCARDPQGVFSPHAAFGHINGKNLGVLMSRHLDHHLRQFGA
jgi:hypothetical protein